MKSQLRAVLKGKLIRNLGGYTLVNLINSSIPFLLLPFLTNYLSATQYAVVDIFSNLSFIFLPLIGLNIASSVLRFFYDDLDFNSFLGTVISFMLIFGGAFLLLAALGILLLKHNILGEDVPNIVILLALSYAFCSQLIETILSLFRAQEKPFNYGLVRISKTIIDLSLSIYCIIVLSYGWEGRVYSMLIGAVFIGMLTLSYLFIKLKIRFAINTHYLKQALVYSSPLILHSLGGYVISFSDRFIILEYMDSSAVGLYAVAYQVGMIMSFANNSFNQAWTPFLFSKLKTGNKQALSMLNKFNYAYFVFMLLLAMVIYFIVPFIYEHLIGKDFKVDFSIILWVLLGYALNGMYKILVNYLFYFKKTKRLALITIIAALLNVFFCILLVQELGILGASISTTIAFFVMFALVYIEYLKIYRIEKTN